jgi:hypothetical protein
VAVTVDGTGLSSGVHTGKLTVTSNGGTLNVSVLFQIQVLTPQLDVWPESFSFGAASIDTLLFVRNTGVGTLDWNISTNAAWLTADPSSGSGDTAVFVRVDRSGLAGGEYSDSLVVTSTGGDAAVPVDLTVSSQPIMLVEPTTLVFTPSETSRTFDITNIGAAALEWTVAANRSWIDILPPLAGVDDATVTVVVDTSEVPPQGDQSGAVTVSSNAGSRTVAVSYVQPSAVPGIIGVYSDATGASIDFVDTGGTISIYIFHFDHNGSIAAQFKLDLFNTGWTWLGDSWNTPTAIGSSVSGVSLGYGGCAPAPTYLGVVNVTGTASPSCRFIQIVPDPSAPTGEIEVVDCVGNKLTGSGAWGYVNCEDRDPVRSTTWGQIKAMYAK